MWKEQVQMKEGESTGTGSVGRQDSGGRVSRGEIKDE